MSDVTLDVVEFLPLRSFVACVIRNHQTWLGRIPVNNGGLSMFKWENDHDLSMGTVSIAFDLITLEGKQTTRWKHANAYSTTCAWLVMVVAELPAPFGSQVGAKVRGSSWFVKTAGRNFKDDAICSCYGPAIVQFLSHSTPSVLLGAHAWSNEWPDVRYFKGHWAGGVWPKSRPMAQRLHDDSIYRSVARCGTGRQGRLLVGWRCDTS